MGLLERLKQIIVGYLFVDNTRKTIGSPMRKTNLAHVAPQHLGWGFVPNMFVTVSYVLEGTGKKKD